MFAWQAVACAPAAPAATALPPVLSPAAVSAPSAAPTLRPVVTLAPTATLAAARTAAPTVALVNVDLKVDGIMSIEDMNTLLLAIRALPGVADVQGSVGLVQVSFDPSLLSRRQIVELITGRGYIVKE